MLSPLNWGKLRDQAIVAVAGLILLYAVYWLASKLVHVIALVLLATVVAYALEPVLTRLERYMPRVAAAIAAYVVGGGLVALGLYFLLGPLVIQAHGLLTNLPQYFDSIEASLQAQASQYGIALPEPGQARGQLLGQVQSGAREVLVTAIGIVALVAAAAADAAFVLLLGFWFMVDGRRIRNAAAWLVPAHYRDRVQFIEETVSTVLGGYIRGQLTLALIVGASAWLGCWALGVPYPLVIGVFAFLFELVPMVGPVLAAVPALLIAVFQPFPLVLYVAAFFIVMQFVENNILSPRISGHAVGLHPVAALIGLLVGFQLGGVVGALFALPAISAASVLIAAAIKGWRGEPVVVRRGSFTFRMPNWRRRRDAA